MKKFLKIFLLILTGLFLVLGMGIGLFIYKIRNGFPVSYETGAPAIDFPIHRRTVLLFSKTTGFRHGESIEAGKKIFAQLAIKNDWFVYTTEEGGVFNPEQLSKFDVVIFNNSTGRVLTDDQQRALEKYVDTGGSLIGIHGAGDDSHHWDWYVENLLGTRLSHHPLNPQLQDAEISLNNAADRVLSLGLPEKWNHNDEWYIFFENPRDRGFEILFSIDGESINTTANLLWMKKDFGMGRDHPVAWYRTAGKGKTFYTSIGHNALAWRNPAFVRMIENAVSW